MIKTKHRHIREDFSIEINQLIHQTNIHESKNLRSQLPIKWDKAVDFNVYDVKGNKWIDLTSGI